MATPQESAAEANLNPSGTLKTSVSIYFPLLALGLLLFEFVRHRFRSAYDSRGVTGNAFWTASAPSSADKPFGWILRVLRVSDDELMERCGLDTLSFLRFLRMGQKVAALAIVLSAVLLPVYATATPAPTTRTTIDPLERINMSHLRERDPRLWAPTVAAFVLASFTIYLLVREYMCYIARRHELLGRAEAPQYSILVDELPLKLRTRATLEAYMRSIFPDDVRAVYVAVECAKLEEYVAEREKVRNALEHALAVCERAHGDRPKHREGRSWVACMTCRAGSCGRVVDSIDVYEERLATLNDQVAREIASIEHAQAQLAQQVEAQEATRAAPFVPQDPGRPDVAIRIDGLQPRSSDHASRSASANDNVNNDNVNNDNNDDDNNDDADSEREQHQSQLERESSRRQRPMRAMRRAAFVSFTSLKAAQVAQQTLQSSDPILLAVSPAPHVDDVNWPNIGLRFRTRALWQLASTALTATIVLFWTIPTAFIASLSTVESLRRSLPFLNSAFDSYPVLEEVFKQIAPLTLVIFNALAPVVFGVLSAREGHASNTEVRAAVFTKLVYFQLIQVFFVLVVVGTVLDSLEEILDRPSAIIDMLGRSMPQQSTFFISYVIVRTGLSLVLELLRVVPLALAALFRCFAPQLTRREREGKWLGLRAVASTDAFDPTSVFADAFLVLLVTLTFAPIAPLVCYFTGAFFVVADIVYRRQVLYVYKPMLFALGAYWPRLYRFLIVALVVAQLTLIGILSLKKAPVQAALIAVLAFAVLLGHCYIARLCPRVAKYLPATECTRLDALRSKCDLASTFAFLDNVYRQPAMSERTPLCADYRMLGIEKDRESLAPDAARAADPQMSQSQSTRASSTRTPV